MTKLTLTAEETRKNALQEALEIVTAQLELDAFGFVMQEGNEALFEVISQLKDLVKS